MEQLASSKGYGIPSLDNREKRETENTYKRERERDDDEQREVGNPNQL